MLVDPVAPLLFAEGLLMGDDRRWFRPDAPGTLQPEPTEYGTTGEAVKRVLEEARGEAAMAWDAHRKAEARAAELTRELRFYADRRNHSGVGTSAVYQDGGRRARAAVGLCGECEGRGHVKTGLMIFTQDGPEPEFKTCETCDGAGVPR